MRVYGFGSETHVTGTVDAGTTTLQKVYMIEEMVWWSLHLETTGTLTGNWTVDLDNRYSPDPSLHGQKAYAGSWGPLLAANFTPNIVAVAAASVQVVAPTVIMPVRAIRVTFTRTANTGTAFIALVAKGP